MLVRKYTCLTSAPYQWKSSLIMPARPRTDAHSQLGDSEQTPAKQRCCHQMWVNWALYVCVNSWSVCADKRDCLCTRVLLPVIIAHTQSLCWKTYKYMSICGSACAKFWLIFASSSLRCAVCRLVYVSAATGLYVCMCPGMRLLLKALHWGVNREISWVCASSPCLFVCVSVPLRSS